MSEEKRKMSAFEAFQQTQQTFAEAEEKAKAEAGAPKVERFRIGEDGEYALRVLPLAPSFDAQGQILPMERKGYEYPLHQFFLGIKVPGKKGKKSKKINIPVIRTTDKEVGYSVDLLDTYVKVAKEMYADDQDLIKLLSSSSFEGGIKWSFQHAMMVLDVSSEKERAKGPQLWQCSHGQYKDLDAAKMRLWAELKAEDDQNTCPISGLSDAYPVKVIRATTNNKTEYTIEIGRKTLDVKENEVEKLLDLPRIPEQIYRYTRYQMEATLAFLAQYDQEHSMAVCKEPDFIDAVEKLKGELSQDDTSHFDLDTASDKGGGKEEVTLNSLYTEYDAIVDQGLNEKSDEYQDLREKIRQFIEDKQLDIRISRSKNNLQLLDEIDEVMSDSDPAPVKTEPEEKTAPAPRPKVKELVDEAEGYDEAEPEDTNEEVAAVETPRRVRRARPTEKPESLTDDGPAAPIETPAETDEDEVPQRRLHKRRLR